MSDGIPTRRPRSRTVTMPREHRGPETAYRFSNGRTFNESSSTRGIYAGAHPGDAILQENGGLMLQENLSRILQE
jgi:hypothetical protein